MESLSSHDILNLLCKILCLFTIYWTTCVLTMFLRSAFCYLRLMPCLRNGVAYLLFLLVISTALPRFVFCIFILIIWYNASLIHNTHYSLVITRTHPTNHHCWYITHQHTSTHRKWLKHCQPSSFYFFMFSSICSHHLPHCPDHHTSVPYSPFLFPLYHDHRCLLLAATATSSSPPSQYCHVSCRGYLSFHWGIA